MELRGFEMTQEAFEALSDQLLKQLDAEIDQPGRTILQIIMTWDEYAALKPAFEKEDAHAESRFRPYNTSAVDLARPNKELCPGGCYRGVDIYYSRT